MDKNIIGGNKLEKKKNRYSKIIYLFYKKITLLLNQVDFLFKNRFIVQDTYIDKMYILNDIQNKVFNLEEFTLKKKYNKNLIENLINDINSDLFSITFSIGSRTCKSTIDIFTDSDLFLSSKGVEYNELFDLLDNYFIPLSSNLVTDTEKFINKYNVEDKNIPNICSLIEYSKINPLIERINGATLIFFIEDSKILYINGYFNKDSLNIFKNFNEYKEKMKLIQEKLEYVTIPIDFKEKYLEQISLKEFIIYSVDDIVNIIKSDYEEFLIYKNKSLSALIKEFIKSNIEKQRRIIILFLISDEEYQFTAHIIFDLITDKSFLSDQQYLSDILFNSLHWKIQKIFKISNESFENSKKKIENITINNVPYESRILSIKVNDNVKAKAMDKLKEINGSKENSVKAQQWLDGFLRIPFNIFKKEPIIGFFKDFQMLIGNYIDIFTIKISEFEINRLNDNNREIYDIIIQIIDEYHSNISKSEYSYTNFIKYIEMIKIIIENKLKINDIKKENNILNNEIKSLDQSTIDKCLKELSYVKDVKEGLNENKILSENNINIIVKKLNDLESMLNINLTNEDNNEFDNYIDQDNNNLSFKKYILQNLNEFDNFINKWKQFNLNKKIYMQDVDKILEKCTYGQTDAKKQMKRIIGQWMNGATKGQCFGLYGPPGVGKTTLCKNGLAKCLFDENGESRPFAFLPLGGATNGSILEGHNYTYLGSTWGKIVDILMEKKCMNPIIYIDELDKISKTEHGKEIISILTHITDQSQNKEFYDRYFSSVPIDLSQVLFIFSYNDRDCIDRILRDRIQEINIKALSLQEKIVISQNYIIPEILENVGFSNMEIIFTNDILTKIINHYTYEAGVRKLNEILYDIVRDINLKKIENNNIEYPIIIDETYIEPILSNKTKINIKKIHEIPKVGLVNGLYATTAGLGGITVIQVMKTISDKKFSLEKLTGSQGDVMKESMNCALTIAWNILPDSIKNEINERKEGFGLHIHCPEGATPKDGPSAGLAITSAIISRMTNIPIRNDIAMTGEIDLLGDAHEIGGLYSKIQGAYNAGVKKVLIPKENEKDLEIIFAREEEENIEFNKFNKKEISNNINDINRKMFRNTVEICIVNNIYEVLDHILVENDLMFNKI